mgnify:FL=1
MIPAISVLMPVYNAEPYLAEAIESILNQTFEDFEFLIINDGSTDNSAQIIDAYAQKDSRIIKIDNEENIGLAASLNVGLKQCNGAYIARMDADDISLPKRFEVQKKYLEQHSDIDLVGTFCSRFDDAGTYNTVSLLPHRDYLTAISVFRMPVIHATIMFRRELYDNEIYIYNPDYMAAEDAELFSRLIFLNQLSVNLIPERLYLYRINLNSNQVSRWDDQVRLSFKARKKNLQFLNIDFSDREAELHFKLARGLVMDEDKEFFKAKEWKKKIVKALIERFNIHPFWARLAVENLILENLRRSRKYKFIRPQHVFYYLALRLFLLKTKCFWRI